MQVIGQRHGSAPFRREGKRRPGVLSPLSYSLDVKGQKRQKQRPGPWGAEPVQAGPVGAAVAHSLILPPFFAPGRGDAGGLGDAARRPCGQGSPRPRLSRGLHGLGETETEPRPSITRRAAPGSVPAGPCFLRGVKPMAKEAGEQKQSHALPPAGSLSRLVRRRGKPKRDYRSPNWPATATAASNSGRPVRAMLMPCSAARARASSINAAS